MTQEHVTITEEVQTKEGLVTQERVTLKTTPDPADDPVGNAAMSVLHPDYVAASEFVYTYNEATGMSESAPAAVVPPVEEETDEDDEYDEEDEDAETDDEDDEQATNTLGIDACGKPVGSGFCVLSAGHLGSHRLSLPE